MRRLYIQKVGGWEGADFEVLMDVERDVQVIREGLRTRVTVLVRALFFSSSPSTDPK